jgi:hypothetical protein
MTDVQRLEAERQPGEGIIVRDNFFKEDLSNLVACATDQYRWTYHHKSDMSDRAHNKFFVCHLWNESSEENLFHLLWKMIQKEIPLLANYYCWRIIANGQVKGQNGNWHTDHGAKTVLYFPLDWRPEWGGSAYFRIGDSEMEVEYKKNRLVMFGSEILHYGSDPITDNVLRVSIAFNLHTLSR